MNISILYIYQGYIIEKKTYIGNPVVKLLCNCYVTVGRIILLSSHYPHPKKVPYFDTTSWNILFSPVIYPQATACPTCERTNYHPVPDHSRHYNILNDTLYGMKRFHKMSHPMSNKMVSFTQYKVVKEDHFQGVKVPGQANKFSHSKNLTLNAQATWGDKVSVCMTILSPKLPKLAFFLSVTHNLRSSFLAKYGYSSKAPIHGVISSIDFQTINETVQFLQQPYCYFVCLIHRSVFPCLSSNLLFNFQIKSHISFRNPDNKTFPHPDKMFYFTPIL